jgi:streptomycin 6-kinase
LYSTHALEIAADLMLRLWRPPPSDGPFWTIADVAARWARELPDRYRGRLLEEALDAIEMLVPTQPELVLCHQDIHGGNILAAEREPWLLIDSKPIVAEPAYDTVAIVRDGMPPLAEARRRLDALSDLLGLDRERMRLWGLVKTLAWDNPDEAKLFAEVGSRR